MVVQYIRAVVLTVSVIAVIATLLKRRANAHRETAHSYGPRQNEDRSENMRQNEERSESMSNIYCIVCEESLNSDEQEKITLNLCRHTFHKICLQSYQLARSLDHDNPNVCPVVTCRTSFVL
uniref:Putative secreted protein n=1 Tax=Triatoma infestans TaxID=30076 RepID=A0A023FB08_TRIIF